MRDSFSSGCQAKFAHQAKIPDHNAALTTSLTVSPFPEPRFVAVVMHGFSLRYLFKICKWPDGSKIPGMPKNASFRSVVLWEDAAGNLCMQPHARTIGEEAGAGDMLVPTDPTSKL